jgi:hypothetical protein
MSVEQRRPGAAAVHFHQQQRRSPLEPHDLEPRSRQLLGVDPCDNQLNGARESREPKAGGVKTSSVLVITSPHQIDDFHPTNLLPS